jgi:hypothetical protein
VGKLEEKNMKKKIFLASLISMKKRVGSRVGSGSISQTYGSRPTLTCRVHNTCPGSIVEGHHHTGIPLCGVFGALHLLFSLIAVLWHQIVFVLAFFRSSSYFLVCKSPAMKASLHCAVRYTGTYLLYVKSTLHTCF